MSEAKAQAKAIRDGFLKRIGEQYDIVDSGIIDYPIAEQMLMFYGKLFNDEVQKNLTKSGSIASGKIGELVVPKVTKFGNDYEMWLGYDLDNPASVYYKYINKGVRGYGGDNAKPKKVKSDSPYSYKTPYANKKMATSILKWYRLGKAKTFGETQKYKLTKTQTKSKKLKKVVNKADSLKILAYATASAIKRDGLKTTSYFDNAVKAIFNKEFFTTMAFSFGGDVQLQIRQIGNKMENNGYNNK
jgi:hypothetical protein